MAKLTQAEKWRRHREAFTLALELGITPREAEAKIREIEERAAARAALARIHATQALIDARQRARQVPAELTAVETNAALDENNGQNAQIIAILQAFQAQLGSFSGVTGGTSRALTELARNA